MEARPHPPSRRGNHTLAARAAFQQPLLLRATSAERKRLHHGAALPPGKSQITLSLLTFCQSVSLKTDNSPRQLPDLFHGMFVVNHVVLDFLEEVGGKHEVAESLVGGLVDKFLITNPLAMSFINENDVFTDAKH